MNDCNLPRLQRNLQVFLEEYLSFGEADQKLLRFDFFYEETKGKKLPSRWHLSLLTTLDGKDCLLGSQGELLGRYDRITPLFCLPKEQKLRATLEDLQDQLLCLRSKANEEELLALTHGLHTLCVPFRSMSAAYLVEDRGLFGVIDPLGQILVPVKYRKIEPFPFREKYGTKANSPVPGGLYGETGLYLCRGDLHKLNATDVYDLKGNLIFQDIADLYPREEVWVTPPRISESIAPLLNKQKQVRSLWVSHRQAAQPFPDAPELQSIEDQSKHYSVSSLVKKQDTPSWVWDVDSGLADRALQKSPQCFRELLQPLAAIIGAHIGISAQGVLDRLKDYRDFYRQRSRILPKKLTPEMPLKALGLTDQAYNCLVRNGVATLQDLMDLNPTRLSNLWRSTPQATQEISELHTKLLDHFRPIQK